MVNVCARWVQDHGRCLPEALPAAQLGDHSYFGYLVVDDADAYYQRAVSANAEIIKPIASEPWGMREFGLRQVDGHRILGRSRP